MAILKGDKVKQRPDLVTIWEGPNGSKSMNTETTYTVTDVFISEFSGNLHLNADNGQKFTGGPVENFIRV
jgi:hypothetical protein|tara:strand:- start:139 stop:348 length:210 start_codon:yes stop_codon:yes gene_type:complete